MLSLQPEVIGYQRLKLKLKNEKIVNESSTQEIIWEKDGAEMVRIPAGSFEMGDHFNEGLARELPVHIVKLDSFYMDKHEVTVQRFRRFVKETGYQYERWDDVEESSPTLAPLWSSSTGMMQPLIVNGRASAH